MSRQPRFDPDAIRLALRDDQDSGWALSAEFLSSILVWSGIGWLLDRWLDTDPWLLVGGIVLGFALGSYLMWLRLAAGTQDEHARFNYRGADDRAR